MRTRIKICGITRAEDAHAAVELGADAIGLVFYPASSRNVDMLKAHAVALATGPFVARVGVFLNAETAFIKEVLASVPLDMLQFHGEESEAQCRGFERPYLKAVPMGAGMGTNGVVEYMSCYPSAAGFLLDSHVPGRAGGSGTNIDLANVPARATRPMILAGGLNAENVAQAVRALRPFGVDVSSGVEVAGGIKDAEKIAAFIEEVKRVDCDER